MSLIRDVDAAIHERYSAAAIRPERELCCPRGYDSRLLEVIPLEVLEKDYGCGDPSPYVQAGDTVLDLGAGSGKFCFVASQLVGPRGRVIGVDANAEMLRVARGAAGAVADRLGYANVDFRCGAISDLRTDHERLEVWLRKHPIGTMADHRAFEAYAERLRSEEPLVPSESVSLVVSNCVFNLVRRADRPVLFGEVYRVLKPGGRIGVADIVSDEAVPDELVRDPTLGSGCISGAYQEHELIAAFEDAGFFGIQIEKWDDVPWRIVRGIEFRSVTVTARKGKEGPCFEGNQAVLYRGPWKKVEDDDGHVLVRGQRTAVCDKTFNILRQDPYAGEVIPIPAQGGAPGTARLFDCTRTTLRHARETKGLEYDVTSPATGDACCAGDGCAPRA